MPRHSGARPVRKTARPIAHYPRKRFGQHFLADRAVLKRIVDAIDPLPGQCLLEIGPGRGALTAPLIERAGRLSAIEIDRDLIAGLRGRFPPEKLQLLEADALHFDYALLPEDLRVVGNLPYNISTPLLFRLCEFATRFRDLHFMLQKEVVERMAARPSTAHYGRLTVMLQHWFSVTRLFNVPPGAFRPPPKVDSAVVRLLPRTAAERGEVDVAALRRVVTAAFSQRRKTIGNALSTLFDPDRLAALGVDAMARAENLSLADYVRLARSLSSASR
ncbi:MAG: 16S rRNA (adenine(1518)-N(6)/adenine(1519)-N(6))-dimethyltransferase [Betaproteobacteria bacterium RIFCSPLOWO2_12_FULL_66_14]|nr:MAG: 16S rRNA (adenine(1518)-N(6)/adenine(1519)-N(6))-dimethyltransferase [Betaproteobacteria bacterium RIFCSPLOWO2_12_FULL_66_14]